MDKKVEQAKEVEQQTKVIYPDIDYKPSSAEIRGYDFSKGPGLEHIVSHLATTGLQASCLGKAIEVVNAALAYRSAEGEKCRIFLGYTSNMVSSGVRQTIRYLAQHKLVDVIVTSAGGVEEDLMKCLGKFHLGQFNMDDLDNRKKALHRIGNILVPSRNYIMLEEFLTPLFLEEWEKQQKGGRPCTPSSLIRRMGQLIDSEDSIYYWCAKNDIPVFCPALTDGAVGDMLFSFGFKKEGFILDIADDVRLINKLAMFAPATAAIVLGGGVCKHHILNANIWRNGAEFAVFINTGLYEDGSDSGAKPSEAFTWAKLKPDSQYVKVFAEASLVFPLLVSQTFARVHKR